MAFIAKHRGYNIKQKIYNSRNYMAFIAAGLDFVDLSLIYNSRNYMAFIASKYGTNIMIYLYITNLCGQIILQFVLPITDNLYILTV